MEQDYTTTPFGVIMSRKVQVNLMNHPWLEETADGKVQYSDTYYTAMYMRALMFPRGYPEWDIFI